MIIIDDLPTWNECEKIKGQFNDEEEFNSLHPLESFIFNNEPNVNDDLWRQSLVDVMNAGVEMQFEKWKIKSKLTLSFMPRTDKGE